MSVPNFVFIGFYTMSFLCCRTSSEYQFTFSVTSSKLFFTGTFSLSFLILKAALTTLTVFSTGQVLLKDVPFLRICLMMRPQLGVGDLVLWHEGKAIMSPHIKGAALKRTHGFQDVYFTFNSLSGLFLLL